MSNRGGDKRHLVPLQEFLKFVCEARGARTARFPKRINGTSILQGQTRNTEVKRESSSSSDNAVEPARSASHDNSLTVSQDVKVTTTNTVAHRKRQHSPESTAEALANTPSAPVECEVIEKTPGKGCFISKYVDFPLSDLGLELLFDLSRQRLTSEVATKLQGTHCCHLLLGTSMIVTGNIVDVSIKEETVMVSPDRGLRVGIEWVSLKRVFQVPENFEVVKEEAAQRIERIMEAARRGEKTPKTSPIKLVKKPTAAPFPASPEKPKE
ncbi:hypothetical protein ABB37_09700 [Leptomonas pyrrhocoris]|uniref:Uncharacterized protein n=1 Tax=Leptomonas pyrrhocoris TaxID=157538 RepID=A0A0M9FQ28_LEPPY|nr:hypothetical protein ABB37_09700 [Leptomonas pyrrhocoris]KPA73566.1 hypothetical protein ABB37_09700 [Leptomonas pyrrhocoris]|eukprot:XP_015652005.1 hypothetical protein ABB37_09700 [Leptomonas pyrrhocoris]